MVSNSPASVQFNSVQVRLHNDITGDFMNHLPHSKANSYPPRPVIIDWRFNYDSWPCHFNSLFFQGLGKQNDLS